MNGSESTPMGERGRVDPQEVSARLEQLDEKVRALCREHPLAMLGGAAVVGYLLARLVSR